MYGFWNRIRQIFLDLGPELGGRVGEKGREKSTSSQLQFVFALKRNITWWDQVEDSADASCVVLHNVPRRYLESFVTDSIGVAFGAPSPVGRRLALKKCCHLKVEFPPRFHRRRKGYPADSDAFAFSE